MTDRPDIDPELDLVLERVVDVRPELVWRAWTEPEHLVKWFTPRPWQTVACEIDLRPGGVFATTMRSPEGETLEPGVGCFLEVVRHERLTWTSALGPEYRPQPAPAPGQFQMTATILLEPAGAGTRYTALVRHADPEGRKRHEDMGFAHGWSAALDQLVEHARGM